MFMKYWAGLNNPADQVALRTGAAEIVNVAMEIHGASTSTNMPRLEDDRPDDASPGN